MRVELFLEHDGNIPDGLDWQQLKVDIQQNVEGFSEGTDGKITKKAEPAPETAQGEDQVIQWLIEVAKDPKMAYVYYKLLCFGVNELIQLAKKKENDQTDKKGITTRIKILGKEIKLPTSVTAIEEFLKKFDE